MQDLATAYHEAGHAVAAAVLDILDSTAAVSVVPNGKGEYGSVSFSKEAWDFEHRSTDHIRKTILVVYAGPAVTKKRFPRVNLFEERGHTSSICCSLSTR